MGLTSEKSPMSDNPKPKNTLATKCKHCDQTFKERDRMTILDGEVLHEDCAPMYLNQIEIQTYKLEFPYLTESEIDKIIYTEGSEGFQTIRDNSWIVLVELGNQEITVVGFPDETAVEDYIVAHYNQEQSDQPASIGNIFNEGTKYDYSVSITASVSPAS